MKNKKFKILGLMVCCAHDEATSEYIQNINRRCTELGYKLLVFNSFTDYFEDSSSQNPTRLIFNIINYDILDGVIILTETIKSAAVIEEISARAKKKKIPVSTIITPAEGCYNITYDFTENFKKIIDHIIEVHDCKRIYFVSGFKGNPFAEERLNCYRESMAEHGLEIDERGIGYGNFWNQPTYELLEKWINDDKLPKPDAIVCANDAMAIATCLKLSEYGYKVPDDIIVTGHDGIEGEKSHSPRLTNAVTNIVEASECAVNIIHGALNGEKIEANTVVPSTLVFSESCGCKPITSHSINAKIMELSAEVSQQADFENHLNTMAARLSEDNDFDSFRIHLSEYMESTWSHAAWICMAPGSMSPRPLTSEELADDATYEPPETRFFDGDKLVNVLSWENGVPYTPHSIMFDRNEILPNLFEKLEKYGMIFFCPIYFRNAAQGYIGLCSNLDNNPFKFIQTFMSYLNMILEIVNQKLFINAAVSQLKSMYILDFLTSLYNRRGFYSKIKPKLENCISLRYDLAVVSVDMDGLKDINDTYGHSEGDYAIKKFANLLCQCADSETIVARFGGDEFVVASVCPDGEISAKKFKTTLKRKLAAYNEISDRPYKIEASIGVSITKPDENTNLDELIELADSIMYRQKANHRKLRGSSSR